MVAVATVTTVCPAGMAVTSPGWSVLLTGAGAVVVVLVLLVEVTPGSPSSGSTNRRRRVGPVGGELYRSRRVVGEGDVPEGKRFYFNLPHLVVVPNTT